MVKEAAASKASDKTGKVNIPEYLVKETIDGIPFYYAGFRSVINKTKTFEEIMADSGLQSLIKSYLMGLLFRSLDLSKYHIFVGEVGAHLDHRNNLAYDLAVFDKKILTPDKITAKYVNVKPKVVVEVDVKVELKERSVNIFDEFVLRKVRKLLSFGTEKIIWIFSRSKTIIVATPGNTWGVFDMSDEVELLDSVSFNLGKYFQAEGINPDVE